MDAGVAAVTAGTAGPKEPGVSGWAPTLRKHTRLNISNLNTSTGVRSRGSLFPSASGGLEPLILPTMVSHTALATKMMSLILEGSPRASFSDSLTSSGTPAQS